MFVIIVNMLSYKYTPANVLENEKFKLYWNRSILMDKTIRFNRPDITFMNKKTKNTFLIDIAVPNTHNLAKTITDKQNKYRELANEICAMWKQKAFFVFLVIKVMSGRLKGIVLSVSMLRFQYSLNFSFSSTLAGVYLHDSMFTMMTNKRQT